MHLGRDPACPQVQIELSLPNEEGRLAILQLLTARIEQSGALDPSALADRRTLARASVGLSGADLGGVVRAAQRCNQPLRAASSGHALPACNQPVTGL